MTTFDYIVVAPTLNTSGRKSILIQVQHNGECRHIGTALSVSNSQIAEDGTITNKEIVAQCEELEQRYTACAKLLGDKLRYLNIDTLIEVVKQRIEEEELNFSAFAEKWCAEHAEIKGIKNYRSALACFNEFCKKKEVSVADITIKSLQAFEKTLADRPRAQELYLSSIVRLFNEARFYFNDADFGIYRIKRTLDDYKVPRRKTAPQKRGLPIEVIRAIFALPYDNLKQKGYTSRHDLAKDCFMLSFCLMGTNSVDLFNATEICGNVIRYQRSKTKDRRADQAEIVVEIPDIILPLVEKYRDNQRVFSFHRRFGSYQDFNRAINIGLKEIGRKLGVPHLQFYAARHSMASIAVNKVGIDKYTVHEMLNHIDPAMRVTDMYIERDFSRINEANRKLMVFVFGEE
ncbi:MAG: phage integrase SAM-like domain-containing protein [Bacteroidaceae bacterium]|nr:phage integrase SAM-like domain-containing protein [Prevotellaceae bacterium]MDY5630901.1 phage integrase SAM-like domain-containing protein [Bacteroidaceae bacterium]